MYEEPTDLIEGSPTDRVGYIIFIVTGLVVLWRRGINWARVFESNRWLFLMYAFWCASILWSDYSIVSFKRLIKDIGHLIMVLIIFSEKNPKQALQSVLARFVYIVIPLSVLFVKYFPDLGRFYNRWTWENVYVGVTGGKNELGAIVLISGLFLVWDFFERRALVKYKMGKIDLIGRALLLVMSIWLLNMADSTTSLICLFLGVIIFIYLRKSLQHFRVANLAIFCLMLLVAFFLDDLKMLLGMLGKNTTLTGRTNLWEDLLKIAINPLIGTGYQSFWLSPTIGELWKIYVYHPNQAHNAYLETYLNGGLIGVILLIATIISTIIKLKRVALLGSIMAIFFYSFFLVTLLYGWTEAIFNRMSPIWFLFLIACLIDLGLPNHEVKLIRSPLGKKDP